MLAILFSVLRLWQELRAAPSPSEANLRGLLRQVTPSAQHLSQSGQSLRARRELIQLSLSCQGLSQVALHVLSLRLVTLHLVRAAAIFHQSAVADG